MIKSSREPIYSFSDIEVNTSCGSLKRGGEERHLRRKSFQVLAYMLERRERLITKEELIENVWEETAVTDDTLVQCIKEIRRTLGDNSHQPLFIKTVSKYGYRFIGSVKCEIRNEPGGIEDRFITSENHRRTINDNLQPPAENQQQTNSLIRISPSAFESRPVLITLIVFIIVLASLGFLGQSLWQTEQPSAQTTLRITPGKKTLAVMYFENQSNSPELDWLRAGLTDMLVSNLSRSLKLTVLSRQQLQLLMERHSYKEGEVIGLDKALEIGRKTQAEAIAVGSFARLGEKIRLDVQIFDVQNGSLQAAESLIADKPEQILTEIDLLSLKLVKSLVTAEPDSRIHLAETMTDNLEAYRYYSLGIEKAQGLHNKEAVELLEKAVALDSQFAMAYARIGYVYAVSWGINDKGKPYLEKAFKLSDKLTEKDRLNINAWYAIAHLDYSNAIEVFREITNKYPLENESYWRLGRLLAGEERSEEAIEILKKGLSIDPEAKDIYNTLGGIYSTLGRHDEAITARQHYVALAPSEPNAFDSLGLVYQWAGSYQTAIDNYNRALELNPNFEIALIHLANTRFQLGQYREAINLYRRYIQIAPSENEKLRGYNCLTIIYLEKQDLNSAEKTNFEALKINSKNYWLSYLIALKRDNSSKVKKLEEQIYTPNTSNDRGSRVTQRYDYYSHGFLALKKNQIDSAIENFKEVIRRPPPIWDMDSHEDCLAKTFLDAGRFDESIAEFNRILQLNPNYPKAHFYLAQIYSRQGETEKAVEFYNRFLQIWANADQEIPEIIAARKFIKESGVS